MNTTGGVVLGATTAVAGTVGVAYGAAWAILLATILVAMFATVFRLVRTIAEGPSEPRPPLPQLTPRPVPARAEPRRRRTGR